MAEDVEKEGDSLGELLAGLDDGQLRALLLGLAAQDPDLAAEIEGRAAELRVAAEAVEEVRQAASAPPRAPPDPQSIRRQVSAILGSAGYRSTGYRDLSEAYERVSGAVDRVDRVLDQARAWIEAGDVTKALACLEAITAEYVAGWLGLGDSGGYASGFFTTLGQVWTQAALVADLSPEERERWAGELTRWQAEIGDYLIDEAFDAPQAAFLQGWDHPSLQRVLQGEVIDDEAWPDEVLWFTDDLTVARLAILERQGRHQEYLNLARAAGQTERYVLMLARLGRSQEALSEGLHYLGQAGQFLALAQELRQAGAPAEALRAAEHGLTVGGPKGQLAVWLSDLALAAGRKKLALRAAAIAFQMAPNLEVYLRIRELTGGRWPGVREKLLAYLRRTTRAHAQVDIFLYEELLDDAMAAAERGDDDALIEQVMDAVLEHRPEWVIRAARREAERIMDAGKAKYYDHAVDWLARAKTAYWVAGREAEWQAYLGEIRERHGRKYKLMGMLKGL
jgi:uncharacterized Zn finger protein